MMPSYYWIKLWIDLIDDYRMASLPDHLWRRAIEAFLLARTGGGDGNLPPIQEVAWKLRITPDALEADLAELERITTRDGRPGIVQQIDGGWFVTNFAKRQASVSDKERQRRKRARDGKASQGSNAPVTPRDVEEEEDVDVEEEVDEEEKTPPPPAGGAGGDELITELTALNLHSTTAQKLARQAEVEGTTDSIVGHMGAWISHYKKDPKVDDPVAMAVPQVRAGIPPPENKPDYHRFIEGDYAEFIEH